MLQSWSVTATSSVDTRPSVCPGILLDGKEHKEVWCGRADWRREIKPIKYVFPRLAEGPRDCVRGLSSQKLMNGEWQTEAGASSKGSFPPSGGP